MSDSGRLSVVELVPSYSHSLGARTSGAQEDPLISSSRSFTLTGPPSLPTAFQRTFVLGDVRIKDYSINFGDTGTVIEPATAAAVGNSICTTRFKWYNWLVKSFWCQFHRVANIYFVIVAVLAFLYIEGAKIKTFVVFSVMMCQAFKDLYEDRKRSKDDYAENNKTCLVFCEDQRSFKSCTWQHCELGSFVKVVQGQQFPADLLVVASSDASGTFFVSTTSLDGETNLKQRKVPSLLQDIPAESPEDLISRLRREKLHVKLEVPQANLLSLDCQIELTGCSQKEGCGLDNFALRGCELQNTSWVIGVASYTGHASKIRLNSCKSSIKITELETYLNYCVIRVLIAIAASSLLYALFAKMPENTKICRRCTPEGGGRCQDWLRHMCEDNTHLNEFDLFIKYAVMLWVILPVTLYIIFEALHVIFGKQIDLDTEMGDACARNTSVIEDLGQVSFVFSDKTGTLTANEMRFAFCFVDGTEFGPFLPSKNVQRPPGVDMVRKVLQSDRESRLKASTIRFFNMMAVCHSVQLNEQLKYQAESPDELALVDGAKGVGFCWAGRERQSSGPGEVSKVKKQLELTTLIATDRYHILCEAPFTSDRKRMSVVIPLDDGSGALVWTKGADSVMENLLESPFSDSARKSLDAFARSGYRTLVYAQGKMNTSAYQEWRSQWEAAAASMEGRARYLEDVFAIAEAGLTFCGITAIEDRLQDGVPRTIRSLREAQIRVWVLTGDKVETAVEISRSCRLFDASMTLAYVVGALSAANAIELLSKYKDLPQDEHLGLVIDGMSVTHILSCPHASKELYSMALRSSSCVCCRLSPLQKRKLIELVRAEDTLAITLAIGDGANDVPMIQGAHVGVGIRGKEGAASVQASDFAISQFCYLEVLMFVHGRKAYRRLATFVCYFFYKSVVICWPYILHAFAAKFRGDVPISPFLDSLYAPLTSWSVALVLAFDEDVSDLVGVQHYRFGLRREGLNFQVFLRWMVTACVHGWLSWALTIDLTTKRDNRKAMDAVFWQASFAGFATILVTVHVKLLLVARFNLGRLGISAFVIELLVFFFGTFIAGTLVETGALPDNPFCSNTRNVTDMELNVTDMTCDRKPIVGNFFVNIPQLSCCILIPVGLAIYDLIAKQTRLYLWFWTSIAVELIPVFALLAWMLIETQLPKPK